MTDEARAKRWQRAKAEAEALLGKSGDAAEEFYRNHRGGNGAVILVTARQKGQRTQTAIFGSLEKADAWRRSLGDDVTCVFDPFMVDDPNW